MAQDTPLGKIALENEFPTEDKSFEKKVESSSNVEYDMEAITFLRKSQKQIGQINDVVTCKQHPDRTLLGRHRTKSAGGLEKVRVKQLDVDALAARLGLSHEAAETVVKIHGNVQRPVSKEETKALILKVAKDYESSLPKEEIAKKLAENLPYSRSYILKLLPDQYKHREYAISPGRPRLRERTPVILGKRKLKGGNLEQNRTQGDASLQTPAQTVRPSPVGPTAKGIEAQMKKCQGCKKSMRREAAKNVDLCPNCMSTLESFFAGSP